MDTSNSNSRTAPEIAGVERLAFYFPFVDYKNDALAGAVQVIASRSRSDTFSGSEPERSSLGFIEARGIASLISREVDPIYWSLRPDPSDIGEESGQLAACLAAIAHDWGISHPLGYALSEFWATGSFDPDQTLSQSINSKSGDEISRKIAAFLAPRESARIYFLPASHSSFLSRREIIPLTVSAFASKAQDPTYWLTREKTKTFVAVNPEEVPDIARALFGKTPGHRARTVPTVTKPIAPRPASSVPAANQSVRAQPTGQRWRQKQPLKNQRRDFLYLHPKVSAAAIGLLIVAVFVAVYVLVESMSQDQANNTQKDDAHVSESTSTHGESNVRPSAATARRTEKGYLVRVMSDPQKARAESSAKNNVYPALRSCSINSSILAELCIVRESDSADGRSAPFKVFAVTEAGMDISSAYRIRSCIRDAPGLVNQADNNEVVPADERRCLSILDANGEWISQF